MLTTVMGWNYRRWVIEELAKAQTYQENVPPFPSSLSSDLDDKTRATHLELARHELKYTLTKICLLYTSPSPRDRQKSRMPSSA